VIQLFTESLFFNLKELANSEEIIQTGMAITAITAITNSDGRASTILPAAASGEISL
jgi:hypothetical protein